MLKHTHPLRVARRAVAALARPSTPLLAQLVVTRRCNLACGYCNEYDHVSDPVPLDELLARVDHLADLGTVVLTLTGGEPLLHPQLDEIIKRVVARGMVCTSITNGYPLTRTWIERLNASGLTLLQISIDNVEPNELSQKSLRKVRRKLELLKENATFSVNVNAVLGSGDPEQTERVVAEIKALGFYMTVGVMHDHTGQLDSGLVEDQLSALYARLRRGSRKSIFHGLGEGWEEAMIRQGASDWRCRAGARYLYIDEAGIVSYCSQRRNEPGIPVLAYGREQLRLAFNTPKGCEAQCTIACVRRASAFDSWRTQRLQPDPPRIAPSRHLPIVA